MCYYNGQKVTHSEFIRLKGLEKLVASYGFLDKPLIQGFPYGKTAILKPIPGKQDFEIVEMEWGLIPDDWRGKQIRNRNDVNLFRFGNPAGKTLEEKKPKLTLNFIGEEIMMNGKKFKQEALTNRCLMLSSGFYEWHHYYPINKRTGLPNKTEAKLPHYISYKDMEYVFFPAIWKGWTDLDTGEYVETVSNATTSAKGNIGMEFLHNSKGRMPTIHTEDEAFEWMFSESMTEQRVTELATVQFPWERMQAWPLDKDFKKCDDPTAAVVYGDEVPSLVKHIKNYGLTR